MRHRACSQPVSLGTGLPATILFFRPLSAHAQNATGSLNGTVTDSSTAVVAGARVVLKAPPASSR